MIATFLQTFQKEAPKPSWYQPMTRYELLEYFVIAVFWGIAILFDKNLALISFYIFGAIIAGLNIFKRKKINKKHIVGELTFTREKIEWVDYEKNPITHHSIKVDDIVSMRLSYSNPLNVEKILGYDNRHHHINPHATLVIATKNDQSFTIYFFILSKGELKQLIPIWTTYYQRKISIKETVFNQKLKTFLFDAKPNSYAEIQVLKKKLNLDSLF